MQGNLYVGLSAQVSLQRRLETIAHNVANASTAGFRAEEVKFETMLSQAGADPVAFAVAGHTFLSRRSGELVRTDNLFDVAVEGDAWLVDPDAGGTGLYPRRPHEDDRDGRAADAQRLSGARCGRRADAARPQRRPAAHRPRRHHHAGQPPGRRHRALQHRRATPTSPASRTRASFRIGRRTPVLDFTKTGMQQGYIERANVNPSWR